MKPIGIKNYGSIGHLHGSRRGPADHGVHEGQSRICTEKARDRHDRIIVTEKLDGSNVGIARVGDSIHALGRAGFLAETSPHEMHRIFADWVRAKEGYFRAAMNDGERIVGEWLAQAHGTRYALVREPFVAFDIMHGHNRLLHDVVRRRLGSLMLMAHVLHDGGPIAIADAEKILGEFGHHGAIEPAEGLVYRVERKGEFDFIAKYVRPQKEDGKYLEGEPVWNWRPESQ